MVLALPILLGATIAAGELWTPPDLAPWPADLPEPKTTAEGSTVLPPELAGAVNRRLLECEAMPDLVGRQLGRLYEHHKREVGGAWRVCRAEAVAERAGALAASRERHGTIELVVWVVGSAAAAALAGFGVGVLAGR